MYSLLLLHSLFRCARNSLGILGSWRWKTMAMPTAVSMGTVTVTAKAASTVTATACADDVATTVLALTSTAMLGSWLNAACCCSCCYCFLFVAFLYCCCFCCFDSNNILIFHSLYLKFPQPRHSYIVCFIAVVVTAIVVVVFVAVFVAFLPFICCKCQSPLWRLNILHAASIKSWLRWEQVQVYC